MQVTKQEHCTGCGACAAACRHITMTMDEEGFRYPLVAPDGCADCGRCKQMCPMIEEDQFTVRQHPGTLELEELAQSDYPKVLAVWNKDDSVRKESSSGGVFSLLAKHVIDAGGFVVGVCFEDDLLLRHTIIDKIEDLKSLRGSKYLQSDMGDVYSRIKTALKVGQQVLFTGTPCQVAGLTSFLGDKNDNLITCDIVCHGVPSEKLFRKYIKEHEDRHKSKASSVSFRNKKNGWKRYTMRIDFANGQVYEMPYDQDNFMRLFLADLCLRPSCYVCPFSTIPRQGDISLADYWGVGTVHPGIDDDQGISLILINTKKCGDLLRIIEDGMIVHPSNLLKAVGGNPCIIRPVHSNAMRSYFMQDLDQLKLPELIHKYLKPPLRPNYIFSVYRKILSFVKQKIRASISVFSHKRNVSS